MPAKELFYEDIELGQELGPLERVVSDDDVVAFVEVWLGNKGGVRFTDHEAARKEGLPEAIVPGIMSMGILSQFLTGLATNLTLNKLDVVFRQPVLHNRPLSVKGIVTDKSEVDGQGRLELDVYIEDQAGERPVGGTAVVTLPLRGS